MTKTQTQSVYQYASSQLDHTYRYLTTPLLTMLPPPSGQEIKILDLDLHTEVLFPHLSQRGDIAAATEIENQDVSHE